MKNAHIIHFVAFCGLNFLKSCPFEKRVLPALLSLLLLANSNTRAGENRLEQFREAQREGRASVRDLGGDEFAIEEELFFRYPATGEVYKRLSQGGSEGYRMTDPFDIFGRPWKQPGDQTARTRPNRITRFCAGGS